VFTFVITGVKKLFYSLGKWNYFQWKMWLVMVKYVFWYLTMLLGNKSQHTALRQSVVA